MLDFERDLAQWVDVDVARDPQAAIAALRRESEAKEGQVGAPVATTRSQHMATAREGESVVGGGVLHGDDDDASAESGRPEGESGDGGHPHDQDGRRRRQHASSIMTSHHPFDSADSLPLSLTPSQVNAAYTTHEEDLCVNNSPLLQPLCVILSYCLVFGVKPCIHYDSHFEFSIRI